MLGAETVVMGAHGTTAYQGACRLLILSRIQLVVFSALAGFEWVWLLGTTITVDGAFVAALFTGVCSLIAVCISSYIAIVARQTHRDVQTGNELALGKQVALNETRRIEAKEATGQPITADEQTHKETVPDPAPTATPTEKGTPS